MPSTTTMPLYFPQPAPVDSTSSGVKATPSPGGFLMDASMASAESFTSMRDDSDAFLIYEDDSELSESESESSDDDDSDDDSESGSEESDSDSSLEHDDLEAAEELLHSIQSGRSNSLRSMISTSTLRGPPDQVKRRMISRSDARREQLQQSISITDIQGLVQRENAKNKEAKRSSLITSVSTGKLQQTYSVIGGEKKSAQQMDKDDGATKPDEHLQQLLGDQHASQLFPHDCSTLEGFFLEPQPQYIAAWTNELTKAVRDHDLEHLQDMHKKGQRLQACNNFGESIVHLCVRRGTPEMLHFLLNEAGVVSTVKCENGRTPLHDAAWCLTDNPQSYRVMALLLNESPMQLFIQDKRGFTPLAYVPRARWAECNAFLDKQHKKGRFQSLLATTTTNNNNNTP